MSKFIRLNKYKGGKVTINSNQIVYYNSNIMQDDELSLSVGVTELRTVTDTFLVQETTEEIDKKIESINKIA